jgi:hypothetical protein
MVKIILLLWTLSAGFIAAGVMVLLQGLDVPNEQYISLGDMSFAIMGS